MKCSKRGLDKLLDTHLRKTIEPIENAMVRWISITPLKPNHLTFLAFFIGMGAAFAISIGWILTAVIMLWLSGALDVLDGALARYLKMTSPFGAYLDIIFDRVVEILVILGMYVWMPDAVWAYLLFLAGVIFNFSTFLLAGALFQNQGMKSMHYDVGLLERTETFICFTLAIVLPNWLFEILMVFDVLMILTGCLRMSKIYKYLKS